MSAARFHLLRTDLEIRGPEPLLSSYRRVFARFVSRSDRSPHIEIDLGVEGPGFRVRVRAREESLSHYFDTEERVFGFVYALVVDRVVRGDPGLLCVHAASLASEGRALIIVAPSGHGKSTLALALEARGFALLSDEVAPIETATGRVLPFPMAVGCRPGSHRVLRDSELMETPFEPSGNLGKMLLEPEGLSEGSGEAARLSAVVVVEPREQEDEVEPRPRLFRLGLYPPTSDLAGLLTEVSGLRSAREEEEGRSLLLELDPGAWVAHGVEDILARHGVLVESVTDLDARAPDFDAEPVLEPLGVPEGVQSLLRHLRGFGELENLVGSHRGGFGGLFMELTDSFRETRFFRLSPGRLPEMCAALRSTLEGGS